MTGGDGAPQPGTRRPSGIRGVLLLVVVLALFAGLRASAAATVGGDFLRYHRAGRLVATGHADRIYDRTWLREQRVYAEERAEERADPGPHGLRLWAQPLLAKVGASDGARDEPDDLLEEEFKYAPALAVMMAPLGALHPRTAWVLWAMWNGALVGVTFAAAWSFASRGASWRWMLLPALVLLRAANDNVMLGQVNLSAIAPATVALWALDRRRDKLAGLSAAFGAAVKFLPIALAVWFAWKRRFLAAALCVVGAVVLLGGLPTVVLGPDLSAALHREWKAERAHVYADAAARDLPGHSVKSFVYRVFGDTHYLTGAGRRRIDWDVSVVHLDPDVLYWGVLGISLALLALVLVPAWGPLRDAADPRGPPEAALVVCWILLASPEARSPHFFYLALPAAVLTYSLVRAWREGRPHCLTATVLGVLGALALNAESESMLGRELANRLSAYCVQGWGTVAVLAALLLVLRGAKAPKERPHHGGTESTEARGDV